MSAVPGLAAQALADRAAQIAEETRRLSYALAAAGSMPGGERVRAALAAAVVELGRAETGLRTAERVLLAWSGGAQHGGGGVDGVVPGAG